MPTRPETIRRRADRQAERAVTRGDLTVFIDGLEILASIGVHPHERESRQRIVVDVTLELGAHPAPQSDRLAETLDYQAVAALVERICGGEHVQLVETLASRIAEDCISDDRVQAVTVRIAKPDALSAAHAAGCVWRQTRSSLAHSAPNA